MKTISFLALGALLFALCVPASAQQTKKIPTIGFLFSNSFSTIPSRVNAFRQGLRDLGYVEGKNIVIEYRYADEKLDRLPELMSGLVRLKVEVVVTGGGTATGVAKKASSTIPVVMAADNDPIGSGFVVGLARPGGNITGLCTLSPELSGKRVEVLKEVVPKLTRLAVFGTSTNPGNAQGVKETELAAGALGVKLRYFEVQDAKDIEPSFRAASKAGDEAVLILSSAVFTSHRKEFVELSAKRRLPVMYTSGEYVEAGGLMYYGASFNDLFYRAATYVDKILKGTKPAALPVEQPTKFEFIVNLKTAKEIGLTIPPTVLAQADKVVK